jgi:hypothetical protein
MLLVACSALLLVVGAQAVHEDGVFQLDGNAQKSVDSQPGSPSFPGGEDADNICRKFAVIDATNAAGLTCNVISTTALTALPAATSSTRTGFVTDGAGPWASGSADDQYTGGSGDDQELSSWKFKTAGSSNDKSDIQNAFFAQYTATVGGSTHKLAYFGGDRSSNNGDENTAFWLLQNKVTENGDQSNGSVCSKQSGCGFNGLHRPGVPGGDNCYEIRPGVGVNIAATSSGAVPCIESATETDQKGDILIVSAFTSGGKQPNIQAYVWMGIGAINPKSGLCVTSACSVLKIFDSATPGCSPLIQGDVGCAVTNQPVLYTSCPGPPADPASCTVGNTIPTPSPWAFKDVDGTTNAFEAGDYFEAGLDLTALGLGGECTSTFTMNTRSSQSVNASLQDLAVGQVGSCTSGTTTTPKISTDGGANYTNVPSGGVTIPTAASGNPAIKVKDHADITVQGISTFGGTVKFSLCGPLALTSTSNCATGGVVITSAASVTGSGGSASVDSDSATLTSVGRYCWRAEYTGDSAKGVPGSSDPPGPTGTDPNSECFQINPVTPTLPTTASCSPLTNNKCIIGATLSDTAALSGTANAPGTNGIGGAETIAPGSINASNAAAAGGSITWHVYGPNSCTTVAAFGATGTSRAVTGDNTYPKTGQSAVSFVPTAIGDYVFTASYSGSSPNTNSLAESACPETATPKTETITVIGTASTASKQRWLPNDRVVLTGDTNLNGDLYVTLYKDADCGASTGEGAADIVYGPEHFTVTNAASGSAYNTTNSLVYVGTKPDGTPGLPAGSYSWLTHYVDTTLSSPADRCETSTVSPITDSP